VLRGGEKEVRVTRGNQEARRAAVPLLVSVILVVAAACSPSSSTSSSESTIGPQTTIQQSRGYTCIDPRGDISIDTKATGTRRDPAGIDLLRASANVEGSTLVVHFLTAGPIAQVRQPLFDMEQGDVSSAPDQSWELRAQPVGNQGASGTWGLTLHTFRAGNEVKTDLPTPVTVSGNSVSYAVPLSAIPPIATLQWQFGSASEQANGTVPFDDCSSFAATTTTTS
jgi:hypothetical protein